MRTGAYKRVRIRWRQLARSSSGADASVHRHGEWERSLHARNGEHASRTDRAARARYFGRTRGGRSRQKWMNVAKRGCAGALNLWEQRLASIRKRRLVRLVIDDERRGEGSHCVRGLPAVPASPRRHRVLIHSWKTRDFIPINTSLHSIHAAAEMPINFPRYLSAGRFFDTSRGRGPSWDRAEEKKKKNRNKKRTEGGEGGEDEEEEEEEGGGPCPLVSP